MLDGICLVIMYVGGTIAILAAAALGESLLAALGEHLRRRMDSRRRLGRFHAPHRIWWQS